METELIPRFRRRGQQSWRGKFRCAFRGVWRGIRGQSTFVAHFFAAAAVIVAAVAMRLELWEWCLLAVCITAVLGAEMFNTALERLAQAITGEHDERIRDALDISSAAVLVTSIGAAAVGAAIFIHRLGVLLDWWTV